MVGKFEPKRSWVRILDPTCHWGLFIITSHKPFPKQALVFTGLQYKSFEDAVGKLAISPLLTVFSTHLDTFLSIFIKSEIVTFNLFQSGRVKIVGWERVEEKIWQRRKTLQFIEMICLLKSQWQPSRTMFVYKI